MSVFGQKQVSKPRKTVRFRFRKYSFSVIYMRCPVRFYTIIALSKREYSAKKPSKNCTFYYYLLMKTLFGGFCRQIAVPFLHKKRPLRKSEGSK